MLNEVVHLSVKNSPNGIFKNMKRPAPNMASGTDPNRIMNGSRKLLNCAARTKDQPSDSKHSEKFAFGRNNDSRMSDVTFPECCAPRSPEFRAASGETAEPPMVTALSCLHPIEQARNGFG
jgi:hypothetical protein